jgi:biopolymer transport protein ExbD
MSIALRPPNNEPLSEINTTPLIDVMLVLLVMLIITLPASTNTLDYPLPRPGPDVVLDKVSNTVAITPGDRITWNGQSVSEPELRGNSRKRWRSSPNPRSWSRPTAAPATRNRLGSCGL